MLNRSHLARSVPSPAAADRRRRRARPRPWPALPLQAQTQLAQRLAHLLRRLYLTEEAGRADRAE